MHAPLKNGCLDFDLFHVSVKLWYIHTSFKGRHIQETLHPRTFEAYLFSRVVKESPHPRANDVLLGVRAHEEPLHPRSTGIPLYCRCIHTPLKSRCIHKPSYVLSKGRCIPVP